MKIEANYDERDCDECGDYTYTFKVVTSDGVVVLELCKKCLLELLKAIIER